MLRLSVLLIAAALLPGPLAAARAMAAEAPAGAPRLAGLAVLMIDRPGCPWCARWEAEIGEGYAGSEEGRAAPLARSDIHRPLPAGVRLARPARYTPTFVLLADGIETGRIEGYPGADFFYPLLRRLIDEAGGLGGGT